MQKRGELRASRLRNVFFPCEAGTSPDKEHFGRIFIEPRAAARSEKDFTFTLEGARREARSALGKGCIYVEKPIERPRQVELRIPRYALQNRVGG